jgi:hypothetical protein
MKTQHFKMVFLGKPWPFPWLFHIQGEPSQVSVPIGLVVEAASKAGSMAWYGCWIVEWIA